jgi:voltage-gated potassium channel
MDQLSASALNRQMAELPAMRGVFRSSGRQLLAMLVALFVSFPFLDALSWGDNAINLLFSLVMLSALLAVGGGRRVLIGGLLLLIPALSLRWLSLVIPLHDDHPLALASCCLFVAFVILQLLRYVLRSCRVDAEVLSSGVSIYLLIGWLWTFLFLLCARLQPHAFALPVNDKPSLYDMFHFSFTTLTTSGYGDILPRSRLPRMLAAMESVVGVLYLAVLVARLVALYTGAEHPESGPPEVRREGSGRKV